MFAPRGSSLEVSGVQDLPKSSMLRYRILERGRRTHWQKCLVMLALGAWLCCVCVGLHDLPSEFVCVWLLVCVVCVVVAVCYVGCVSLCVLLLCAVCVVAVCCVCGCCCCAVCVCVCCCVRVRLHGIASVCQLPPPSCLPPQYVHHALTSTCLAILTYQPSNQMVYKCPLERVSTCLFFTF
jgi:hypothetical protein